MSFQIIFSSRNATGFSAKNRSGTDIGYGIMIQIRLLRGSSRKSKTSLVIRELSTKLIAIINKALINRPSIVCSMLNNWPRK